MQKISLKEISKNKLFIKGLIIAFTIIFFDQALKIYMLDVVNIDERPPIEVLPFFNLVMVWNRGVSFGMGNQLDYSHIIFFLIALFLSCFLTVWMYKAKSFFAVLSLALIIGGAIGNMVDRIRFKAVADFFDFHLYGYHWPAFNIADSAIFCGAFMFGFYTIFLEDKEKKNAKKK